MFKLFYQFTAWFLWLIATPILLFFSIFYPKLRLIFYRFLLIKNPPFDRYGVWFHAASFGEIRAIAPLVSGAKKGNHINITVATKTGFVEAKRLYPFATVRFLPFENLISFWATDQKALIVFDAELWFMLFETAKKKGIKTALFNARISDKSLKSYQKLSFLYKRIFARIDYIFAQSEEDKRRIEDFGAKAATLGNIKLLQTIKISDKFEKPTNLLTVAASTHEGEEILIATDWHRSAIGGQLFVVPRHPERFDEVASELAKFASDQGLSFGRYSDGNLSERVVLIDSLGLLNEIYTIADIVVLGGSFVPKGGHNPLEPAFFGCKLISGEMIDNQKPLFEAVENVAFANRTNLLEILKTAPNMQKSAIKNPMKIEMIEKAMRDVLQ